jgi:hypothetical protein
MKTKKRLPIPQHEFGFARAAFNLIADNTLDGWRIAREHTASEQARRKAEAAQSQMVLAAGLPRRSARQQRRFHA